MSIIANKNVLITGGASGIGEKLAYLMAIEGAHVVIWDINQKHLDEMTKSIPVAFPYSFSGSRYTVR